MNAVVKGKAFKRGNSVAVRLPKSFGLEPGTPLTIEQRGDEISIKRVFDQQDYRQRLQAMFDDIAAIWERAGGPPKTVMERDPDIFPDRPGLY